MIEIDKFKHCSTSLSSKLLVSGDVELVELLEYIDDAVAIVDALSAKVESYKGTMKEILAVEKELRDILH